MLDLKRILAAKPKGASTEVPAKLSTVWGEEVARCAAAEAAGAQGTQNASFVPRGEHPQPQFARASYVSLNGWWTCAFVAGAYDVLQDASDVCAAAKRPAAVDTPILVPFSPEADLSGVGRMLQPDELLWYRGTFEAPEVRAGERCLLHFEAVDDSCAVWCNGQLLGTHNGGYLPFAFDITEALAAGCSAGPAGCGAGAGDAALGEGRFTLELCVADPSERGIQLRGKQKIEHGDLWYTAQSGIWQPVWLEVVSAAHIESVSYEPDVAAGTLTVRAKVAGQGQFSVVLSSAGEEVARAAAPADEGAVEVVLAVEQPHLWSPDDPFLYDVELQLVDDAGCVDLVRSYCAWRTVCVQPDAQGVPRVFLNSESLFVKGVLDQGYWPESLMTAPADEAFIFDIEAMKAAGFNMLRKHIKLEAARYYYHCDRLGMLVWQDMVTGGEPYDAMRSMYLPTLFKASWGSYSDTSASHWAKLSSGNERYRSLWLQTTEGVVQLLANHPCVITWVLFNEGWGQFSSEAMTARVRKLDPTRPIESVSGWYDQGAGDYYGVHNYFRDLDVFPDRKRSDRACVTCEFGGLVHNVAGHAQMSRSFGYDVYETQPALAAAVRAMLAHMDELEAEGLAGYVYTQVSDVEEETNGILTYDRKVNKLA